MGYPRLTAKQAEVLRDRIRPMLHFLHKCRRRLDTRGFDPRGPIYQAIEKAYSAVYSLHTSLHYESCTRGVGVPEAKATDLGTPADPAQGPANDPGT
jgi:hypothetical protein